ncbi:MAG: O-antigen ligase family protein [Lentisphaeria bacterium]
MASSSQQHNAPPPLGTQRKHRKHSERRHFISHLKRKIRHRFADILTTASRFPLYGALLLLFFFPLLYSGGALWWLPAALTWTFLLYAFWLLSACWQGGEKLQLRVHPALLLLLLPLLAGCLQLLPLGSLVKILSPQAGTCWTSFNDLGLGTVLPRITLAPDATRFKCQLLLLCLLLFCLLYHYSRHRKDLFLIMITVVASALGNASIAFWQFFTLHSGRGLDTVFTGTFHNRNHFGFMMSMGILAALGLLSTLKKDANRRFPWQPAFQHFKIPLVISIFLLIIAQVLSLSRGAFLATALMLCCYAILWWLPGRQGKHSKKTFPALLILVFGALLFALQTGISMLVERYEKILEMEAFSNDTRVSFWKDTLRMAWDFPLAGTGFGAFRDIIQKYESGQVTTVLADHAHNDWLEFIAEAGIPLSVIVFLLLFLLLFQAAKRLWKQPDPTLRWLGFGALAAILAGLIHECFDFNLQAMSNAVLFSALLAVLFSCARKSSQQPPQEEEPKHEGILLPGRRLIFLLLGGLLILWVLPQQIQQIHSAVLHAFVREGLLTREQNWQPKRNDYLRWLNWADQALQATPKLGMLHLRKATCAANLAELDPENARQHWQTAMSESAAACQRGPGNGEFFLACAQIHELGSQTLGLSQEKKIVRLYERSYLCHPRLLPTLIEVAEAYSRAYWRFLSDSKLEKEAGIIRLQTMRLFSEYLALAPTQASQVFQQILTLSNDPDELLQIAPQNLFLQQKLLAFLCEQQNYDKAFELLEQNQKEWLTPKLPTPGNLGSSAQPSAKDWFEWQCTLLGLTKQWQKRDALMPEFQKMARHGLEEQIQKNTVDSQSSSLQAAQLTVEVLCQQPPLSYSVLLQHAELLQQYGHHGEICNAMLPFAYAFTAPPMEYLEKAIILLGLPQDQGGLAPPARQQFLAIALAVLAAETSKNAQPAMTHSWLQELQQLEQTSPEKNQDAWLQHHLYPFFQGRIHQLRSEFAEAAQAYQRSLQLSPQNLLVWQQWQKLPPKFRAESAPAWAAGLTEEVPLEFAFTNAVQLQAVRVIPKVVSKFHQTLEIEFFWLCTGDVLEDCQIQISFQNASGTLFTDSFSFLELHFPMINWRVGEIVTCKRQYKPLLQSIQNGKLLSDSSVVANVKLRSLFQNSGRVYSGVPKAVFPVFNMQRPVSP